MKWATCDVWTRWPHHGVYTYLAGLSKSNQEKSTKKATAEEGKLSLPVISHSSGSPSEYAKGLREVSHTRARTLTDISLVPNAFLFSYGCVKVR